MGPLLQHAYKGGHDVSTTETGCHRQVALVEVWEVLDGGGGVQLGRDEVLMHLEGQLGRSADVQNCKWLSM